MKKFIILLIFLGLVACSIGKINETIDAGNSDDEEISEELSKENKNQKDTESLIFNEVSQKDIKELEELQKRKEEFKKIKNIKISSKDVYSKNICLMDVDTGEVLMGIKENDVEFPASLTKIMTTIVAIENCDNINSSYTLDQETYDKLISEDASMAGFLPGENVPFQDLLYGTMMPSGADASLGLAYCSTGNPEDHVKAMNQKVKSLGLKNTHFTNVTGLHNPNNYSTAKDMAEILRYALTNNTFEMVITKDFYRTQSSPAHINGIDMEYSVVSYAREKGVENYKILGGKTGFTEEAGLCLASLAEINGHRYILVTFGALQQYENYEDAIHIYNLIFQNTDSLAS